MAVKVGMFEQKELSVEELVEDKNCVERSVCIVNAPFAPCSS